MLLWFCAIYYDWSWIAKSDWAFFSKFLWDIGFSSVRYSDLIVYGSGSSISEFSRFSLLLDICNYYYSFKTKSNPFGKD